MLIESGYIQEQEQKSDNLLIKLDKWTSKLPLIVNSTIELILIIESPPICLLPLLNPLKRTLAEC